MKANRERIEEHHQISVIKVRNLLIATVPPDPDDSTLLQLQETALDAMIRYQSKGVILDLSLVDTMDSFFAKSITDFTSMVKLAGGRIIIAGLNPSVAITVMQLGLFKYLDKITSTLSVDLAINKMDEYFIKGV